MELKQYWPAFLEELLEFGAIAKSQQPEFDAVGKAVWEMPMEFSAFTLTAAGIARWEAILGISGMEADDLDSRRFRIQSRLLEQIPITKRTLYNQLSALCGEGGFTLSIDYGSYGVGIRVALTAKSALKDVEALAQKSVPANMVLTVELLYNQYGNLTFSTHAQLQAYTNEQLRSEVF